MLYNGSMEPASPLSLVKPRRATSWNSSCSAAVQSWATGVAGSSRKAHVARHAAAPLHRVPPHANPEWYLLAIALRKSMNAR
eukprot:g14646.t1